MSDSATWAADGIALLALGLSGYAVILGEVRSRRDRGRQLAVGPADELRSALADLRTLLSDVANVGQRKPFFTDPTRKQSGQRLSDLAARVSDTPLREQLDRTSGAWDTCFALAPAKRGGRVHIPGQPDPPGYRQKDAEDGAAFEKQCAAANDGIEASRAALDRLNELERG